jgi:hypothetical protein
MGHKLTLASYRTLCRSASWWLCINDWISPTISCGFKMQGKAAGIEDVDFGPRIVAPK